VQAVPAANRASAAHHEVKEHVMGGELIGLVAVILGMGVPLGALYTYYRVRKLHSEERLAALGIIPLAVGVGYFLDWTMIRRDARA
jgi:cadmium resistance protein CadD (predicted permease)